MGLISSRRHYGELRLPVDRRRHQRVSWLDNDLRTRRAKLLRDRWRDLAVLLSALAVSATAAGIAMRHEPLLLGLVLGTYMGAIGGLGVVLLSVVDGSLHPRLGRWVEHGVGMDLRRTPGVYGVVSDVSFEHVNVDHIVLTRRGCFAVEVKSSFSRRQELVKVRDLASKVAQARHGARQVERLLRSRGVDLPVAPVLLLTGPGAPFMPPVVQHGEMTVTDSSDPTTWGQGAVMSGRQLDLERAARAASELLAYREERTRYENDRRTRRQACNAGS